uniref:Zinc finger, CCCH-type n=1 Tax=Medicago truncatula TaxID=3880 RepID=A2Q179_MEDTR|nr:Zinc finger, CCCH-type [Medicago truncatula]
MDSEAETSQTHMRIKTQLCRRFMQGTCPLVAPQCNYAHGYHDLRTATGPRLCRMFMHTRHCSYGNNCRFLHATPPLPLHHVHPQQQQHENINFSFPQPLLE